MLTKEQFEVSLPILQEVLEKIIYKIRTNDIIQMVYLHYHDGFENINYKPTLDFEGIKFQIKSNILTKQNKYWKLDPSKISFVEFFIKYFPKHFNHLKSFVDNLLVCDLTPQAQKFEKERELLEEEKEEVLKKVLQDKYSTYGQVAKLVMDDTMVYPYKSDKIKIFLEMGLDTTEIYGLMQLRVDMESPVGYIEKFKKDREKGISQKKIVAYEVNSVIEDTIRQLRR